MEKYQILMQDENLFAIEWAFITPGYHPGNCLVKVIMENHIESFTEEHEGHVDTNFGQFDHLLDPMTMGEIYNYLNEHKDQFPEVHDCVGLYLVEADEKMLFNAPIQVRTLPEPEVVSDVQPLVDEIDPGDITFEPLKAEESEGEPE